MTITKTNTSGVEWTYKTDLAWNAFPNRTAKEAAEAQLQNEINTDLTAHPERRILATDALNTPIGNYPRPNTNA